MAKQKVFISSVQTEFTEERQVLFDYLFTDSLLGRFFEPFLFEKEPASDQSTEHIYLKQVEQCNIYLALLGKEYGNTTKDAISPTEQEFDRATELHKTRLVFLTNHSTNERNEKQNKFIEKVQSVLVRKRFSNIHELKSAVYAALVNYLIEKEIIRIGPFDASINPNASLEDIDPTKVEDFIRSARSKRGFPLLESAPINDVFEHLNLIKNNQLTNASLLLFGKNPQRFFINSEVRCAHFHGVQVEKPIPSFKAFKGDVFELVDQSLDFILSKLDYSVGTRSQETAIPGKYEIPKEILTEALVNAIAHRDYTSNGSVQVMMFRDRVEIINPGSLPLGWSIDKLKKPHASIPFNPLLAEPMYLKGYIERMGTGTADIIRVARENKLQEPVFEQDEEFKTVIYRPSTDQVPTKYRPSTDQVPIENLPITEEMKSLLLVIQNEMSIKEILEEMTLKHKGNFRENYLEPALKEGLIEQLFPTKPNHPKQKYRLTEKGNLLKDSLIKR